MLRQESPSITPDRSGANPTSGASSNAAAYGEATRVGGVDIARELNKLEEMILDSPRIPLSRRTLVDEEQFLDQLDLIRINLPPAFQEAVEIVRQKEEILLEAEQYAQEIIETAERRAAQILDETNLVRQAELEVNQIRQQMKQECEAAQEQTMAEIERMRRQAQQDLEEIRRRAIAEAEEIQAGADAYADSVLRDMEQQLAEMLRVIRNGRQQLQLESAPQPRTTSNTTANRPPISNKPPERKS
ncbi:DivIVA domain-containing protein [Oscillatoria sp. FACHB-1407]|uniref:DivIVA domain-containing protein n=1 Tax=Oscillatoria sp. FACHB-1407 TaxID=2692847 RepID=UPI001681CCC4|nr:DivIVA domain-containing protein [Oscillatoria sp. FACHB-1407]MBD2460202.1 DivIVA domain-containing protein [Oscillatoria sp. FACHB-1407]